MEQRTLNLDGTIIYCYEDGSIECDYRGKLKRSFGCCNSKREPYKRLRIKKKKHFVHRLIATAFIPNPNNLPQVDHINRNKEDNRPINLRWVDNSENQKNTNKSDRSLKRIGICITDNKEEYFKSYRKHILSITKEDGCKRMSRFLSEKEYNILKPLSTKERFLKLKEIDNGY